MSTTRKLLKGKKFSDSHSTVTKDAEPLVMAAKALPSVKKVVLGTIESVGPGQARLKINTIRAGLKIQVRGGATLQNLYIYYADNAEPMVVSKHLQETWNENHR